jgi:hypothetical protein
VYGLLGCNVVQFGGIYCFHLQSLRVSQKSKEIPPSVLAWLTLRPSRCRECVLLNFCRTMRRHTPEGSTVLGHRCENFKSTTVMNLRDS